MTFADKLKELRTNAKLSQAKLGEFINVDRRTIMNYEKGKSFPRDTGGYRKLAKVFSVDVEYLMSDSDEFIAKAYEVGGISGRRSAETLINEVGALFAGGTLSEDDKDAMIRAFQDAYWDAKDKEKNKK